MAEVENILPQNNGFLLGQTEAEEIFLKAWKNNTLHHAWILSGPQGIGKATLAYRIARFLLWADTNKKDNYSSLNIPENSQIFQQIAGGSHPDLKVLEKDYIETDKRKIISAIRKGEPLDDNEIANLKKSAFIRIDDVRKINDFLSKTSFNDGWRIVIIDSADDMNKSAANALLKILEEPPAKTILLLISHNAGTLLPTIRSRCSKLPMHTLKKNEVASLLRRYRSNLSESMVAKLAEMSDGSIGKAIRYADYEAVDIYNELSAILYAKRNFSLSKMLDFCNKNAIDDDKFTLLQELLLKFIKDNMAECQDAEALYACWQEIRKNFADCVNINMDRRVMLINILNGICKVL